MAKRLVQIAIGFLLIFSGLTKSLDTQSFALLIISYGFVWFQNLAPIISLIEVVLGLCFVFNIYEKRISITIGILMILFTIAYSYAFFVRNIEDCGCFGSLIKVSPIISFIRNIIVIIGCFWIWKTSEQTYTKVKSWKKWVIYLASCITIGLAEFTFGIRLIEKNKVEIGENISNSFLKPYKKFLTNDLDIVFIFRTNCLHCLNTTENVKSIKSIPEFSNLIGITYQGMDTTWYIQKLRPNFDVYLYPTDELNKKIKEVPVLIILKKGVVQAIYKANEIPCGEVLKKMYRI